MKKQVTTRSPAGTCRFAQEIAAVVVRKPQKRAVVIALTGELGAGKTTFAQAFAKALGVKERVQSPTFVLIKAYALWHTRSMERVVRGKGRCSSHTTCYPLHATKLVHIDCYRLHKPEELMRLGLWDALKDHGAIVLVEWAERIRRALPEDTVWVNFLHGSNKNERIISIHEKTRHS